MQCQVNNTLEADYTEEKAVRLAKIIKFLVYGRCKMHFHNQPVLHFFISPLINGGKALIALLFLNNKASVGLTDGNLHCTSTNVLTFVLPTELDTSQETGSVK